MTSCFDEPLLLTAGVARLFYLFPALREKTTMKTRWLLSLNIIRAFF